MALDRQSIEKKDFPIGRRGYDPEAVDAHLKEVADQVEELETSGQRRTDRAESLAAAASSQVQTIVDAAEVAAAKIQADAEQEADEIRQEARNEAKAAKRKASAEARQQLERISEATSGIVQRVDAIDQELGGLVDSLRTAAARVAADLELLDSSLGDVQEAVSPGSAIREPEPEPVAEPEAGDQGGFGSEDRDGEPAYDNGDYAEETAGESGEGDGGDIEGARLIALNMALNGSSREEVDRYLAENFQLSDRGALIDEVYHSVEG